MCRCCVGCVAFVVSSTILNANGCSHRAANNGMGLDDDAVCADDDGIAALLDIDGVDDGSALACLLGVDEDIAVWQANALSVLSMLDSITLTRLQQPARICNTQISHATMSACAIVISSVLMQSRLYERPAHSRQLMQTHAEHMQQADRSSRKSRRTRLSATSPLSCHII